MWKEKIRRIVEEFPSSPSQKKFCKSVGKQIESNPDVFPTEQQAKIIGNIFRHYTRLLIECPVEDPWS